MAPYLSHGPLPVTQASQAIAATVCTLMHTHGPLPVTQAAQAIGTIKWSGRRLLQLINDVLDAAKMKQGELVIRHEHVDVRRLVFDVMEMSEALLAAPVKLRAANVRMHAKQSSGHAKQHPAIRPCMQSSIRPCKAASKQSSGHV